MPQIQLLDGKKIPFTKSINGFDLTKKISKSLEKTALIMEVDGQLKDLSHEELKLMGNEGRKNITKKFDVEIMCDSNLREYKKLLKN